MLKSIVECVPNFSEARRPEIIEDIMQEVRSVAGVHLLDRHSDLDHNRTVLTFAGTPQAVEQAAFQAIAKAAQLIDLNDHNGEHPRIGATDVVPFVPISGVTMQDCIDIANRLGKRVGDELGIPVYLYEEAARIPERRNLEDIRRGQYEALKEEIGIKPERQPDYGPAKIGPAGATVIGARQFLIAYNVYLSTSDVSIAKKIAKAVRHSSGGLRYVKALGLSVDGRAQVSMNLTNYEQTPIARVVEIIRREAIRYGVSISESELVGLIPKAALIDAAVWYLQLDQFKPEQVLENKLDSMLPDREESSTIGENFLDSLAAATATPGGGSAAAYSGAIAAALVSMVCRLTIGKKKYAEVEKNMLHILDRAESLRASFTSAIKEDAEAFEAVRLAYKLPKDEPHDIATRQQAIHNALIHAAQVPLQVARQAVQVLELAVEVVIRGNLNAISDGASGAAQARSALTSAGYNVRINIQGMADSPAAKEMLQELLVLEKKATQAENKIKQALVERGGISFE